MRETSRTVRASAPRTGLSRHTASAWAAAGLASVIMAFALAPWPVMDKLFAIAYGICPQRPGHSLFFGGQQMSIEARMFGMFAGAVAGMLYLVARGRGKATGFPRPGVLALLVGFVALMAVDGFNAFFFDLGLPHLYSPNLLLRLGTGLLAGLAISGFIMPAFNQTIWVPAVAGSEPVFSGWPDLLGALGVQALLFGAGLTGWSLLLYPYSVLASASVLGLLSMIWTILVTLIRRREGTFTSARDLLPSLLLGLLLALVMLAALSAARFLVFGLGR